MCILRIRPVNNPVRKHTVITYIQVWCRSPLHGYIESDVRATRDNGGMSESERSLSSTNPLRSVPISCCPSFCPSVRVRLSISHCGNYPRLPARTSNSTPCRPGTHTIFRLPSSSSSSSVVVDAVEINTYIHLPSRGPRQGYQ